MADANSSGRIVLSGGTGAAKVAKATGGVAPPRPRRDVAALAASFFLKLAPNPQRKPEAIAAECVQLAEVFYAVCDQAPNQAE